MRINHEQISAFWQEVTSTIESLLDETDMSHVQELMSDYEDRLKEIDGNLTFHFERNEIDEQIEMVFGCDGYTQSIASVINLVQAAPNMKGVQVIAFNPRHDEVPAMIKVAEATFVVDTFFYEMRITKGELHLSLYIDDLSAQPENPNIEAAMIYLDAILGEFDMMTRVSTLNFYRKPAEPIDHGLKFLSHLRKHFDSVRAEVPMLGVTVH